MSKSKNKRLSKLVAKKQEQSARLNLLDKDGKRSSASILLEKTIAGRAGAVYYQCAAKDKSFRPFYVTVKPISRPFLVKMNRHGEPVISSKVIAFRTISTGISRPIPLFKDGAPRFNLEAPGELN